MSHDGPVAPEDATRPSLWLWMPAVLAFGWLLWDLQQWWTRVEDYNFGWLVPFLSGYFIWDDWERIKRPGKPVPQFYLWTWLAVAPVFLLVEANRQLVSAAASASWLLAFATLAGIAATILATQGTDCLKRCLFPLLFLLVAVPPPGSLWHAISQQLQRFVAASNVEILNLLNIPALQQGNVIQLARCEVGIDEACSGIRSLQSSIMVALLMGKLLLSSPWLRVLLVLLGPCIAIPGNLMRTLILSLSAHFQGIEAMRKLHDAAGWSIMAFTLVGLGIAVYLLRRFETPEPSNSPPTPLPSVA